MFNFFANLAIAIYFGQWLNIPNSEFVTSFIDYMKAVPLFGLFNNSTEAFYNTGGVIYPSSYAIPGLAATTAVILSGICCISIFWIIVRSIYRLFQFLTFER